MTARLRVLRHVALTFMLLVAGFVAVLALPLQEVAAGNGPGGHNHGSVTCGSDWYISVTGAQAQRNGSPGPGGTSRVFYRAVAYQWNGSEWVYSSATPWQVMFPFGYGVANFKSTGFQVNSPGYFAVQTEFFWYDYRNLVFYGSSAGWASGGAYCTYR